MNRELLVPVREPEKRAVFLQFLPRLKVDPFTETGSGQILGQLEGKYEVSVWIPHRGRHCFILLGALKPSFCLNFLSIKTITCQDSLGTNISMRHLNPTVFSLYRLTCERATSAAEDLMMHINQQIPLAYYHLLEVMVTLYILITPIALVPSLLWVAVAVAPIVSLFFYGAKNKTLTLRFVCCIAIFCIMLIWQNYDHLPRQAQGYYI
jgi:hypothetical protein